MLAAILGGGASILTPADDVAVSAATDAFRNDPYYENAVSLNVKAVTGADAAVIVTEWPELTGLTGPEYREAMARPLIIDGRNLLDPEQARAAGFEYEGIGRPTSPLHGLPETAEREPELRP